MIMQRVNDKISGICSIELIKHFRLQFFPHVNIYGVRLY